MKYTICNICGSGASKIWGVSVTPSSLHYIQVRCRNCGLFYANPQCTAAELTQFYRNYYSQEGNFHAAYKDEHNQAKVLKFVEYNLSFLKKYAPRGKLLDVGSGLGLAMKAAQNLGYEPYGVEVSPEGVEYAQKKFGLMNARVGMIEDVAFEDNFFDAVYTWHVIEHVPDLMQYLRHINRLLKPGGILMIGTENNVDLFYTLKRYARLLMGQVPDLPTSTEHTYGFTAPVMKKILQHAGFQVLELMVYEDNLRNSFCGQVKRGSAPVRIIKKIILYALYGLSQIFPTGKKLRIIARKK